MLQMTCEFILFFQVEGFVSEVNMSDTHFMMIHAICEVCVCLGEFLFVGLHKACVFYGEKYVQIGGSALIFVHLQI